jgi:cadmium resistance protein CadD (predicted permease)
MESETNNFQFGVLLGSAVILQVASSFLVNLSLMGTKIWVGVLGLLGLLVMIRVCRLYAVDKGYSPSLRMLGFLSALGLLILLLLPRRRQDSISKSPTGSAKIQ